MAKNLIRQRVPTPRTDMCRIFAITRQPAGTRSARHTGIRWSRARAELAQPSDDLARLRLTGGEVAEADDWSTARPAKFAEAGVQGDALP